MVRWAGTHNGNVCVVSDQDFICSDYQVIPIPSELDNLSSSTLIKDFRVRDEVFIFKRGKKIAKELRVAFIANYGDECGIGTFSKFLFEELAGLVGDYKIFAEKNDYLNLESAIIPKEKIVQCWKRGQSVSELVAAIKEYNPTTILIEHEFGLWSNARNWLSLLTQLSDFHIIVELHSTFPNHTDKIILENAIPEAIVHLQDAKDNLLHDKKLNTKVHVIGHGCYPIINQQKLWNNYKSDHTFITVGFGFKYKNFEDSIRATAILKTKYLDVFFTALFSESPHNKSGHQSYYNELIHLIEKLGVQENVGIIRGFHNDFVIDCYLRSNQVAVFPYLSQKGHEVFGASGAIRMAFAAGLPAISSILPHFSDTPSIKTNSSEEIAEELDKLFSSNELKMRQIKLQNEFVQEKSWYNIAFKYIDIFEGMDAE